MSFFSNTVASTPLFARKYAADSPAGPPPMTAALTPSLADLLAGSSSVYPFSAASSLAARISTGFS